MNTQTTRILTALTGLLLAVPALIGGLLIA